MEPGLKSILEGYRGDVEVCSKAVEVEVSGFTLHLSTIPRVQGAEKDDFSIDTRLNGLGMTHSTYKDTYMSTYITYI